ncbi:hypothetical protein ALC57_14859 [Trachymyrmex cornetzi]|uniref:Endonuclease/exonuclease/phosphatase domain-containing protein n=1 Tax=Trachymyrmex cornetzi TaxID=471704 RepID=A0A151IXJ9_9HYME|nr:hypothetical protein ALC57_14859 [Trachymyrmex cornetzi]
MEEERIREGRVRIGEKNGEIEVFVKDNLERYRRSLEKWMEEKKEEKKIIIGGDFSARTGKEGNRRKSKGQETGRMLEEVEEEQEKREKKKGGWWLRRRKTAMIVGEVWGIGKRRFGKDWSRRIWLFDKLIWMVMSYGVEVWGWKERVEVERLEERYLR